MQRLTDLDTMPVSIERPVVGVSARQFPQLGRGLGRSKMGWPECAGSFVKVVEPFGSLAPPNSAFCKIRALPCEI